MIVDTIDFFINPGRPIPKKITEMTRITDDMVKNAPGEKEIISKIKDFIKGSIPSLIMLSSISDFSMKPFFGAALEKIHNRSSIPWLFHATSFGSPLS
jgi:DNA polymerase-3 subunit alpha (Gram-positive type)